MSKLSRASAGLEEVLNTLHSMVNSSSWVSVADKVAVTVVSPAPAFGDQLAAICVAFEVS